MLLVLVESLASRHLKSAIIGCLSILAVSDCRASITTDPPVQLVWVKQFGTDAADVVNDLSIDHSGNIYAVGEMGLNAFVARFDGLGNEQWTEQLGTDARDSGSSIALDTASNRVYISGWTGKGLTPIGAGGPTTGLDGAPIFGDGESDAFVAAYTGDGTKLWSRVYGTLGDNEGTSIEVDSDGNSYTMVTQKRGSNIDGFIRQYDPNGQAFGLGNSLFFLTGRTDHFEGSVIDTQDNMYIAASIFETLNGTALTKSDMALIKFSRFGTSIVPVWTRQLGTGDIDAVYDVALNAQGSVFMAGITEGNFPGFSDSAGVAKGVLAKYDDEGNLLWLEQFGADTIANVRAVEVDAEGNAYVAGRMQGGDLFLTAFDPDGNQQWFESIETPFNNSLYAMAIDSEGSLIIAGETIGSFDGFTNLGSQDAFIAKFVVPEPASCLIMLSGSIVLMNRRRRNGS